MNFLQKLIFRARGFFFPQACAVCGGSLINVDEMSYGLCGPCRAGIKTVQGNRCNSCGKPLISELDTCLFCRNAEKNSYDRLWVIFPYTGKYRDLLAAYKFKKNLALARFLAEKIMEIIDSEPVLKDAQIVPVPPRPGKIKTNGWDQVEYLVRRLEKLKRGRIGISRCLERRKSKVQKRLNRSQRKENLKGRICLKGTPPQTVLILDDVTTTGSTMEVCATALKEGGAQKVYGLCLFYD